MINVEIPSRGSAHNSALKDGRSVFQRLQSPTTYTGIPKEKIRKQSNSMPQPDLPPPPPAAPGSEGQTETTQRNSLSSQREEERRAVIEASRSTANLVPPPLSKGQSLANAFDFEFTEEAIKSEKMKSYIAEDVFKRLQSTKTVAAEKRGKKQSPIPEEVKLRLEQEREKEKDRIIQRKDKGVKVVQVNLR